MNQAMLKNDEPMVIYNMPEKEYHALPYLSSSGIKKILTSAQDFWKWSWFNEDKDEDSSRAFNVGTAYHKRILEGKEAFDAAYAVKPECDRRTKAGKAIYEAFKNKYPDAEEIDEKLKGYIEAAWHRIEHRPEFSQYFVGDKELTVLWKDQETGTPMKARLDCISGDRITDLKTFSNPNGSDLKKLAVSHIARYDYYIQAAVYMEAAKQAGFNIDEFVFFFQQSGPNNNCLPVKFPLNSMLYGMGKDKMREGINKFRDFYHKFGKEEWFEDKEMISLEDEDFPLWLFD